MEFKGKKALITGAAAGIGRAVALLLASRGADVALLDINLQLLKDVEREIKATGSEVLIYECDISDEARVNEVAAEVLSHFGKIDILVNNAAIWRLCKNFVDVGTHEWKKMFDINVMGTVYVTRAFIGSMLENSYGKIINVASVAGVYGNICMTPYSATKGAIISFTKALAKEVTDKGITVNSVSPGTVSPAENRDIDFYEPHPASYMGRSGTDRENAELICFLASDKATYISGQNILIDGCRKTI